MAAWNKAIFFFTSPTDGYYNILRTYICMHESAMGYFCISVECSRPYELSVNAALGASATSNCTSVRIAFSFEYFMW